MPRFLIKPYQYSSYMQYCNISTEQWNRMISKPPVIRDKADAPLAIWGKLCKKVEYDLDSHMPRCTGDNIEEIYALPVDVDNGTTMESFERDFHRYSYQLYTTYSWCNGKPGDRFRVFFPLREPLKIKWLEGPVKSYLLSLFDMADPTCFDKGHWQVLPCVAGRDKPYRYVQHQGELLSFAAQQFEKQWKEYHEDVHWKREIAEADRDPNAKHDGALAYVQKIFDSTQEGARNRTVYAKLRWLHDTVGATYNEVITLRPPMGFDDEYTKMVERLYV